MPIMLLSILCVPLAVAAIILLFRGICGDRSNGRLRCPKCWYDMYGSFDAGNLDCPECGHDIQNERLLRKTRRSWRAVVLGTTLLAPAVFMTSFFAVSFHRVTTSNLTREAEILALVELLKIGEVEEHRIAAFKLMEFTPPLPKEVIPALIVAMKDKNPQIRFQATVTVGSFGVPAKAAEGQLLTHEKFT